MFQWKHRGAGRAVLDMSTIVILFQWKERGLFCSLLVLIEKCWITHPLTFQWKQFGQEGLFLAVMCEAILSDCKYDLTM